MKPIFLTASLLITAIFSNLGRQPEVLTAGDPAVQVSTHSVQDDKERAFMPARRVLEAARVSFDPGILLGDDWRERITAVSARIPEMRTNLRVAKEISGFVAADTLVLPANVKLTGDTVILARTIVYEGYNTTITGRGKNVYVFNIDAGFHTLRTFGETMADRGIARESVPAVGERTAQPFEFRDRRSGIVKIVTDGLGRNEWWDVHPKGRIPGEIPLTDCPPQTPVCNGDWGATGQPGTGGPGSGTNPPLPHSPLDGYCRNATTVNGLSWGEAGDNGATGPDNPYLGGKGGDGQDGGQIHYVIPRGSSGIFTFSSRGGHAGDGGPGGDGSPGDPAQDGGRGGNGADCPCNQGGAGSGSRGDDGGRGGKGGKGGTGGQGGKGGNGGRIYVDIPQDFPRTHLGFDFSGGEGGDGGDGGLGGYPGSSGSGGAGGRATGNSNCPTTEGVSRSGGIQPSDLGRGEKGATGSEGADGSQGSSIVTDLPPATGECERPSAPTTSISRVGEDRSEDLFVGSKDRSSLSEDPYCCNNTEAAECTINGGVWDDASCTCISPIIVDVLGNGFDLTDAAGGVLFDILNQGAPRQVSWTTPASDDAFLALDRNNNGRIDKGKELFGSSTPQPRLSPGETKNGFRALAVYDRYGRGGNYDGKISRLDSVYDKLLLWQDVNHNGVSDGGELFHLEEIGLKSIDLDYTEHRRHDDHGNWFRFRSKVRDTQDAQLGRWAWDVFLQVQ